MLETDGHFREKLQAANAEDIKVRLGTGQVGGNEGRVLVPVALHSMPCDRPVLCLSFPFCKEGALAESALQGSA